MDVCGGPAWVKILGVGRDPVALTTSNPVRQVNGGLFCFSALLRQSGTVTATVTVTPLQESRRDTWIPTDARL